MTNPDNAFDTSISIEIKENRIEENECDVQSSIDVINSFSKNYVPNRERLNDYYRLIDSSNPEHIIIGLSILYDFSQREIFPIPQAILSRIFMFMSMHSCQFQEQISKLAKHRIKIQELSIKFLGRVLDFPDPYPQYLRSCGVVQWFINHLHHPYAPLALGYYAHNNQRVRDELFAIQIPVDLLELLQENHADITSSIAFVRFMLQFRLDPDQEQQIFNLFSYFQQVADRLCVDSQIQLIMTYAAFAKIKVEYAAKVVESGFVAHLSQEHDFFNAKFHNAVSLLILNVSSQSDDLARALIAQGAWSLLLHILQAGLVNGKLPISACAPLVSVDIPGFFQTGIPAIFIELYHNTNYENQSLIAGCACVAVAKSSASDCMAILQNPAFVELLFCSSPEPTSPYFMSSIQSVNKIISILPPDKVPELVEEWALNDWLESMEEYDLSDEAAVYVKSIREAISKSS